MQCCQCIMELAWFLICVCIIPVQKQFYVVYKIEYLFLLVWKRCSFVDPNKDGLLFHLCTKHEKSPMEEKLCTGSFVHCVVKKFDIIITYITGNHQHRACRNHKETTKFGQTSRKWIVKIIRVSFAWHALSNGIWHDSSFILSPLLTSIFLLHYSPEISTSSSSRKIGLQFYNVSSVNCDTIAFYCTWGAICTNALVQLLFFCIFSYLIHIKCNL